jgi:hypothetical protein
MNCSICRKQIETKNGWSAGHNAEPINDGRCCDVCNATIVIPARINIMKKDYLKRTNKNISDMR